MRSLGPKPDLHVELLVKVGRLALLASLCTRLDDAPNYLHNMHVLGTKLIKNKISEGAGQALHLLRALSTCIQYRAVQSIQIM